MGRLRRQLSSSNNNNNNNVITRMRCKSSTSAEHQPPLEQLDMGQQDLPTSSDEDRDYELYRNEGTETLIRCQRPSSRATPSCG